MNGDQAAAGHIALAGMAATWEMSTLVVGKDESMNVDVTEVEKIAEARLPTRHGVFIAHAFRSCATGIEHLAVTLGLDGRESDIGDASSNKEAPPTEWPGTEGVLVRMHSECLTGDALGSLRCDCGEQLDRALSRIAAAGMGVLLYLRGHEGRGIGLAEKIRAYALQDQGHDTHEANLQLGLPADARRYDEAARMLKLLGVCSVRLLTNNPAKLDALEAAGITVVERLPLALPANAENAHYLLTKQRKFGHLFDFPEQD